MTPIRIMRPVNEKTGDMIQEQLASAGFYAGREGLYDFFSSRSK